MRNSSARSLLSDKRRAEIYKQFLETPAKYRSDFYTGEEKNTFEFFLNHIVPNTNIGTPRVSEETFQQFERSSYQKTPSAPPNPDLIPANNGQYSSHQPVATPIAQAIDGTIPTVHAQPFSEPAFAQSGGSRQAYMEAPQQPLRNHNAHHTTIHYHSAGMPWWWFWLNMSGPRQTIHYNTTNNYINSQPTVESHPIAGGSSANNDRRQEEDKKSANFRDYVLILIAAGVTLAFACGSVLYLASELWNNGERFYYNEGYVDGLIGMGNIVLSLSLAITLTDAVLSSALTAATVSAGFSNPVGWAFMIMGFVALFVAAVVHWVLQQGIYGLTAALNPAALDPAEPGRFTISTQQVNHLNRNFSNQRANPFDGNKIQNVITAIHDDMTTEPTTMMNWFRFSPLFRDPKTANNLATIRELRMKGKVDFNVQIPVTDRDRSLTLSFNDPSVRIRS